MPLWLWFVDSLALILAVLLVVVVWIVMRRRVLIRRSGAAFDMSVNRHDASEGDGHWTLGFAIYRGAELHWFRAFSVSLRPRYRFVRGDVSVEGRRSPHGKEPHVLQADHVVVSTHNDLGVRQLALSSGALTGLMSWLESSPPGQRVNNVL